MIGIFGSVGGTSCAYTACTGIDWVYQQEYSIKYTSFNIKLILHTTKILFTLTEQATVRNSDTAEALGSLTSHIGTSIPYISESYINRQEMSVIIHHNIH